MKKISKLIFASAALLAAFVSCQKVEEISEAPKTTHVVRFTTEMPTKTSYVVDGNSVKYSWEEADIANLKVFEDGTQGDITNHAITDGVLSLEVSFTDSQESSHIYTAYLNGAVKSEQVETGTGSYDPTCDVLVAKPVQSSELGEGGAYTFSFRRPVAITELKLKGLTAGEKVSKVTVISDSEHPIAGKYTQSSTDDSTGDWSESSNKIVVSFGEAKTVGSDGILPLSIVTRPIKEASVKVLVETENGLKYRKVTASALTLLADVVKAQGIGLTSVTEAEHAEDGWYLVTDASELFDGDEIRIACPSKGMIAGEFAVVSEETKEYLVANAATFTLNTYDQLTGIDSEKRPNTFTLVENYGSFALVNESGKLGTKSNEAMSYDDGTKEYSGATEWTIAIADNLATISTGETYGRILCNVNSSRFRNYTSSTSVSMLLPHIYKKYGTPEDPIIKIARTSSFSPESTTVTIDADDNVFPELSFEPAGAMEGTRTWTSSNTEVATVDNEGNVTLLTDGTTTISVEIAATDTYQPCSAEYVLTVKPAPVQGLDIIDNDFIGTPGSYTSWKDKASSSSGKTYAGNSTTKQNTNNIQMRSTKPSGIVVTASDGGKVARKITVKWDTSTDRTIDVYGKDSAYSSEDGASDLYDNSTDGDKLGSIVYGTSTELEIEGDYEFIGLRSKSGALYVESITIQWEDPKPKYEACFKDAGGNTVTEVNATVGSVFTAPTLYKGATSGFADAYESSNPDVAEVSNTGVVTLHKKGDAIITATLNGDETHRKTEVPYTIHVANVLSSIEITTEPTKKSYYVGDEVDYSGIAVTAHYNDETSAEIAYENLTFSGFDSSEAVAEQAITVSYTENDVTKTASYNVEIKAATTLYDIDVTAAADANGNSVTVEGSKEKAEEGDEITLNVNLATGYKLTSLKVNEVEHSADVAEGKYTFNMPAAAVTVTASFDNHYNVVLGSATNGSFTVNGKSDSPVSVEYGTEVNLVATPSTGYEFKTWTVEGAFVASAVAKNTTFTMPAGNVTVGATFAIELPKTTVEFSSLGYSTWGKDAAFSGNTNDEVTQTKNHVTFTYTRNTGSCYANTTSIRFYKDNNLTFSVPTGCQIVSIEWGGSNWQTDVTTNKETCNCTSSGLSWSGEATSVTFSRPSSASSYVTLSSVTVKYTGTPEGGDTPTKLSTPTGLVCSSTTSSSLTFTWDEVANASEYKVSIDDKANWISTNKATTYTWTGLSAEQTKTIYVKAIGDGEEYLDSDAVSVSGTTKEAGQGGDTPSAGTVMWSETWQGGEANETPSSYGQEGTTVYNGGTVTYSSTYSNTKLYNDTMASTNLLLYGNSKGKDTWVVTGIPTGGVSKLTLTLEVNNNSTGRCVISSPTSGVEVGTKSYTGTASPYTITVPITITGNVSTFELNFANTTTSNVRIDNVKIVVAN